LGRPISQRAIDRCNDSHGLRRSPTTTAIGELRAILRQMMIAMDIYLPDSADVG